MNRAGLRALIPAVLVLPLWLGWTWCQEPATGNSSSGSSQGQSAENFSAQAQQELKALIGAGTFADLRWPNFTDYQIPVSKFYDSAGYSATWLRDDEPTPQARAMIRLFKQASLEGLDPEAYDASRWDGRLAKLAPSVARPLEADLVHFDLALTVSTMRYISDLHIGRVNPQHFKFGLDVGPQKYDLPELLRTQVVQANDVDAVIAKAEPPYSGYRRVEAALATYSKLAQEGDGEPLPIPGKAVRPGNAYPELAQLIRRLRQLGDYPAPGSASGGEVPADSAIYEGTVVDAVKHFQQRHGLESDGALGKGTIAALNVPLSVRVRQLQLTLERYRWMPPHFPEAPLLVNIPEFRLRTFHWEPGGLRGHLSMNVVVGKAYRHQTPVFADNMRYLVFRPYWNVPPSIQHSDLVPKIRRDRNYLAENRYEVTDRDGKVVTDGAVTDDILSGLAAGSLSIRQKPGPKNALGLVKFIFPNSYNVYLHGTPSTELFSRARRDFSHGCIRVQDPVGLAAWVLRDKPEWNVDRIRAVMNGDQTLQVNLDKPIPVLILYATALVEEDGEVLFFDDIYGHDASLEKVLAAGYPYPG
jgi:murein L,D-transpeptidase YcbB/YkuD